jgi:DNA repair photolyase
MDTIDAKSLFNAAAGFIKRGGFDWTCNPYVGCTFGCTYCYARYLPQNDRPQEDWGRWFVAKKNAVELARKHAKKVAGQSLYMSSVTDPYQPIERSLLLTRGILDELLPHQPKLVVQTRGPLVVRDIDVLSQFHSIRVNISIPTDDEDIRRAFEPKAPPLEKRWEAIGLIKDAGIPVGLCVTPTLPLRDVDAFIDRLAAFAADVLVIQDFHDSGGGFGADTSEQALQLAQERAWGEEEYRAFKKRLRERTKTYEGEEGFFPPFKA